MKFLIATCLIIIASIASPASALEFRQGYSGGNCSTCAWIAADGEIIDGDDKKLLNFVKKNDLDYQKLIVINSPGGNVSAALDVGRFIRSRGMRVIVGLTTELEPEGAGRTFQTYDSGVCASACVFILMGGVSREIADNDSKVGVHQFAPVSDEMGSIQSTTSSTQSAIALLQAYAITMGVGPTVLTLASGTRPENMLWLEPEQMERLNLLTTRTYRRGAEWNLKPASNALMAVAAQEQPNGRITNFVVDCRSLLVGFDVPNNGRLPEIAASIRGAELTLDGSKAYLPLTITNVSVHGSMIVARFQSQGDIAEAIANSGNRLNIDVDLPWAYMEEFGGPEFDIPTSNFTELRPHIRNSCR
jgi:hypothetical protein